MRMVALWAFLLWGQYLIDRYLLGFGVWMWDCGVGKMCCRYDLVWVGGGGCFVGRMRFANANTGVAAVSSTA